MKRDASPPTAHLVVTGTEGANGWYTSNVTVTVEGDDPTSGATCTGGAVLTDGDSGHRGHRLAAPTVPVWRPTPTRSRSRSTRRAPTASTGRHERAPLGDNGWYTSDVTVATSGDDSVSGPVTCTPTSTRPPRPTGTPFTGTCTNAAGLVGHAAG